MILPSCLEDQVPLIWIVESDDMYLKDQADVLWFELLRDLDWRSLRPVAARYYEALWQFNVQQAQQQRQNALTAAANPETQAEATCRLLFERATLCEDTPILHEVEAAEAPTITVAPSSLRPGQPPPRWAGRRPKCFFAMLKAFIGTAVCGLAPEPALVHDKLKDNPSFARTCGFTLPNPKHGYHQSDVPSLRKLEPFDQVMSANGLWGEAAVAQVAHNLKEGRIKLESTLVHDTTHYQAFSAMQVVELPAEPTPSPAARAEVQQSPKTPKRRRKSHPKTTKACKCPDRAHCRHEWLSADSGAGTIVKSTGKMYWGHKASTFSFATQEILLDAVPLSDAASHDSESLYTHLPRLFQLHPELRNIVTRVLDDGAADDQDLKDFLDNEWQIELAAPINPRRRRPITKDLPRGIDHLTPRGTPVCQAGYPLEFVSCRHQDEKFLFQAPNEADGVPVCQACRHRATCCRGDAAVRHVSIGFERLPWIDPNLPQLSKRFAKLMAKRTVIERIHKLMKFDFGDDRLTKRGNNAFAARLDKTLLAMHLLLAHD